LTDSGPPRNSFALFGGPGFILALLLLFSLAAAGLYLVMNDRLRGSHGASMSLPGDLGNSRLAHQAPQSDDDSLEPLQPMQAPAPAEPVAEAEPAPEITEDLSPLDLLVRYTPDPNLALAEDEAARGAQRFRRPSSIAPGTARLALVVTGLGLDRAQTAQTIVSLPPDVTLSFVAGAADLEAWIAAARAYGHEALIDLELGTAQAGEEGEDKLLAELGPQENLRRLEVLLARAPEAAGVHVRISDAFLADAAALTPILDRLQAGGWLVVGLPITAPMTVAADRQMEAPLTPDVLAQESVALKALARQRGAALSLASAANAGMLAQSLARPSGREIALVPASALVEN
jgi:polysaccharide deacetylase 2 family uncharacterized protein YibQ